MNEEKSGMKEYFLFGLTLSGLLIAAGCFLYVISDYLPFLAFLGLFISGWALYKTK